MLKLKDISKRLGTFKLAGINIEIAEGEYFILLGRSGSGKTQLLELIAGLNEPDSGEIWINGENVTGIRIQERNTGLVFQDYAIFPNMTVFGNVAYSLHARKYEKSEIRSRVEKVAGELNITHLLNRSVQNLSGGELQRVALARTLITSPKLLLLDEPLASIDASLKDDIKKVFRKLNKGGLTIVHVTHDYNEALSLATRVGVIHNGRIIQSGSPDEVFSRPVNRFVARYAGVRNFFRVTFHREEGCWLAKCNGSISFRMSGNSFPPEGLMIVRDNGIEIHSSQPHIKHDNCFRGVVKEIIPSDHGMEITVEAGEKFYISLSCDEFKKLDIRELSEVWITFPAEAGIVLQGGG